MAVLACLLDSKRLPPHGFGARSGAVIGITAGLKPAGYSCLLGRLLFLPDAARGSVRRRGSTRASSCSPDKSHIRPGARLRPRQRIPVAIPPHGTGKTQRRMALFPNRADRSSFRSFWGSVLPSPPWAWLDFLSRSRRARPRSPKTAAAALPALGVAPPPLAAAPSNSVDQTIGPEERLARLEPPPIQIGVGPQDNVEAASPPDSSPLIDLQLSPREAAPSVVLAPLPPSRPLELAPPANPPTSYDQLTAVYDISAHTVYLPNGMRLEAHSGLGDRIDDPRFVDERDHGATPPGVYQLTMRELIFHGVQALRLNPIGTGFTFNRVGLLAHPYMLGPNGDFNGCVSFKTYDVFLRAFQNGEVKRLAVVARWTGGPRQAGAFASLSQGLAR